MLHYWLLVSWFGSASLQFISSEVPAPEPALDTFAPPQYPPLPYINYLAPPQNVFETYHSEPRDAESYEQFYPREERDSPQDQLRKRRMAEEAKDSPWLPNLLDTDKTLYMHNDEKGANPFVVQRYASIADENATEATGPVKRSFSPWGGKRSQSSFEHMWTWKRADAREPSMPKRVRFSPWGGKRSGQMIYKPGAKGSRIIFSTSIPELTKIVSNYSPNGERFDLAGFRFIPSLDKRHPIKILALSGQVEHTRDALPFKTFLESLPRLFKLGHPYLDVNLKKDGKRKVKFSAWGGKRSPPIIGPIWTPATHGLKESALDTILLLRNGDETMTTKAQ